MAFCTYCGASLPDNVKFCPSCGKPVNSAAAPKPQPSIVIPAPPDAKVIISDTPPGGETSLRAPSTPGEFVSGSWSAPKPQQPQAPAPAAAQASAQKNQKKKKPFLRRLFFFLLFAALAFFLITFVWWFLEGYLGLS